MSIVKVTLTHSASGKIVPEKRYSLTQTIESIKQNSFSHFGTEMQYCHLALYDEANKEIEHDMKDEKMLGYYQCKDGYRIHVIDTTPVAQMTNYDDTTKVEKYTISEEDYLKREDNVRAFKQRMLEMQKAEMAAAGVEVPQEINDNSYAAEAAGISVGDRCMCSPGDRLGTVRYVGRIAVLKPGYWVGVEFDEPVGKSDGSVKGTRVFECAPMYGGFLRPDQVTVGDFPPEEFENLL